MPSQHDIYNLKHLVTNDGFNEWVHRLSWRLGYKLDCLPYVQPFFRYSLSKIYQRIKSIFYILLWSWLCFELVYFLTIFIEFLPIFVFPESINPFSQLFLHHFFICILIGFFIDDFGYQLLILFAEFLDVYSIELFVFFIEESWNI